jgi:outer membrane autotransporter protein
LNKRALMLTAATAALMSGPAFAACPTTPPTWTSITTNITVPVDTACANSNAPGTITIATSGSVTITTNPFTTPAVTIDSGTTSAPGIVTNGGTISYVGVNDAVGVQLTAAGNTGAIINAADGIIDLTGDGDAKTGILVALPTGGAATGTFTGIAPPTVDALLPANYQADLIAIDLQTSSTLKIEGTDSFGIQSQSGTTLVGDIDIAGTLAMTPTSTTGTSATNNYAINLAGTLNGNLIVEPGGVVSSTGDGAVGVVTTGVINGAIVNFGSIETVGTSTPTSASNSVDPEAAAAFGVGASVTGGIYNAGPTGASGDVTVRASIIEEGTSPALIISAPPQGTAPGYTTIGYYNDAVFNGVGGEPQYGIINRGNIVSSGVDPNTGTATAVSLEGSGPGTATSGEDVYVMGGLYNSGSISTSISNTTSFTGGPTQLSTAIVVGQYSTVPTIYNDDLQTSSGKTPGTISASVSGPFGGTAYAIEIAANGMVTTIDNNGVISATASTTTLTISNLRAEAIIDSSGLNSTTNLSGTITAINNTGEILAATTALNNDSQVARAIDLSGSTQSVTITNSGQGVISGDIVFGSGINKLVDSGSGSTGLGTITGDIYFGGTAAGDDTLHVEQYGEVSGSIFEGGAGKVDITVDGNGWLNIQNSTLPGLSNFVAQPVIAGTVTISDGAAWSLVASEPFNLFGDIPGTSTPNTTVGAIVQAHGLVQLGASPTTAPGPNNPVKGFALNFGSFVTSPGSQAVEFALISAPTGDIEVSSEELETMNHDITVPFLFDGTLNPLCTQNITPTDAATSPIPCAAGSVVSATDSQIDLVLQPKTAAQLGLTGYALKMFPYANAALANDTQLGAGVVAGVTSNQTAQQVYSAFAPDVSGATRATAISLTDSATDIVSARQRELRMYANQEGDTTLWGQEFVQRLSQDSTAGTIGYNDSGFGFALGMDSGDPSDGRYGGAVTFFSGGSSTLYPADQKTNSEFYLGTFYTDWRGRGLFLDSQVTAGWAHLSGERFIDVGNVDRQADGQRPAAMLAGGLTSGAIFNFGSTVITPQVSVDGLTMREDSYTEANGGNVTGGDGFDLHVQPYYASSARIFAGADLREDINFGDFYIQPQARIGYRYDFLDGAVKLNANFVGVTPLDEFSIEGPEPSKGNIVLGGGLAFTTGAWSLGGSFDYLRANSGNTQMDGMLTLLGRI